MLALLFSHLFFSPVPKFSNFNFKDLSFIIYLCTVFKK